MKTLNEIYAEVLADETLKNRFLALRTPEEQAAFVKELGGEASAEEIAEFLNKQQNKTGELSDEELDQVVGGKGSGTKYYHSNCGGEIRYEVQDIETFYRCSKCGEAQHMLSWFDYYEA